MAKTKVDAVKLFQKKAQMLGKSIRPGLDALIGKVEKRIRAEEEELRNLAGPNVSVSCIHLAVRQGLVFTPRTEEEELYSLHKFLDNLKRLQEDISTICES